MSTCIKKFVFMNQNENNNNNNKNKNKNKNNNNNNNSNYTGTKMLCCLMSLIYADGNSAHLLPNVS